MLSQSRAYVQLPIHVGFDSSSHAVAPDFLIDTEITACFTGMLSPRGQYGLDSRGQILWPRPRPRHHNVGFGLGLGLVLGLMKHWPRSHVSWATDDWATNQPGDTFWSTGRHW